MPPKDAAETRRRVMTRDTAECRTMSTKAGAGDVGKTKPAAPVKGRPAKIESSDFRCQWFPKDTLNINYA